MIISRHHGRSVPNCTLALNGQPMERVHQYKYLGVVLTDDLTWSAHIREITNKARKVIGLLYRQYPSTVSTIVCPQHLPYFSFIPRL